MCPPTLTFGGGQVLLINLLPCTPAFPFLAPWQVSACKPDPLYQGWAPQPWASFPNWPCSGLHPDRMALGAALGTVWAQKWCVPLAMTTASQAGRGRAAHSPSRGSGGHAAPGPVG